MSVIKARLRKQAAEFISLREVFELLMKDGEGCTLADAAKFLCQVEIIDPIDFLPDFLIYDKVQGCIIEATSEQVKFYWAEIKIIACGVIDDSLKKIKFNCDAVGFKRSEPISFMGLHGIGIAGATEQSSQPASDDAQEHLRQLEADKVRLIELVLELEQRLRETTAAPQQAPQEAGQAPQQATAAPQDDEGKLLHPKRETTYLNTIGALVELIQTPRSGRDSEAAVIREILDNYGERPGISKRTLEGLFPEAKKRVQSV